MHESQSISQLVLSPMETYHALHDLVYECFALYQKLPQEFRVKIFEAVTPLLIREFTVKDPTPDRYLTRKSHHFSPDNVKHNLDDLFIDGYGLFCEVRSIYLFLTVEQERRFAPMMRELDAQFARLPQEHEYQEVMKSYQFA